MNGIVVGSTLAAAYASVLLQDLGHPTQWHFSPSYRHSKRPLKLSENVMTSLRRLCRYYGMSARLNDLNPNWFGALNGELVWSLLHKLATRTGVIIEEKLRLEVPVPKLYEEFRVLAADPLEVSHWPKEVFMRAPGELYVSYEALFRSPTFFNSQFFEGSMAGGAFCFLESSLVFVEAVNETHFVLSVVSNTQFHLDRALTSLQKVKGHSPLPLKSLLMSSQKISDSIQKRGVSMKPNAMGPDWLALGPSFGEFSALNLHSEKNFMDQVQSFRECVARASLRQWAWGDLRRHWVQLQSRRKASSFVASKFWDRWLRRERHLQKLSGPESGVTADLRNFLKFPL